MSSPFIKAACEFIDLVNRYVGVYVDSCSGFEGNTARVERQVHRVLRAQSRKRDAIDGPTIVMASFEDPRFPDALHHRIIAANEYLDANGENGLNARHQAESIIVFLFTAWELHCRKELAAARGIGPEHVVCDVMGDLRLLRITVLHHGGVLKPANFEKLLVLKRAFSARSITSTDIR